MKLYLFGGAEVNNPNRSVSLLKQIIKKVILEIRPETLIYIPFARLKPIPEDQGEWDDDWLSNLLVGSHIPICDSRNSLNIKEINNQTIFIGGGPKRQQLVDRIKSNSRLHQVILNADNIIGESAGSMILGEFFRTSKTESTMAKGLGLIKNCIIEPHYTERNYKRFLPEDLENSGARYGLGIDSSTGIVTDPDHFPAEWRKLGVGNVFILDSQREIIKPKIGERGENLS